MIKEEFSSAYTFLPFQRSRMLSRREALNELTRPCAQFHSPFTTEEKVRFFLSKELSKVDMLESATQIVAPGTPLNWQVILRYLYLHNIITSPQFSFIPARNDLPKAYYLGLHSKLDQTNSDGLNRYVHGSSHGTSVDVLISKAIGETLERHFLAVYRHDSLLRSSYADLLKKKKCVLNIFDLNSFLPWQEDMNARFKKHKDSVLYWVLGETADGKPAYIPAQLAYWTYDFTRDSKEPLLAQPTTNAAAGHFTKKEAVLAGLLEHIQRDGFLIYWLNNLSPHIVDVSKIENEDVQKLLAKMKRYGIDIYFLNTTSDIEIPSLTCALVDMRAGEPIIALGGGTGFDFNEMVLHSAHEALSVINHVEQREAATIPADCRPFCDTTIGRQQRITMWRGNAMRERFSFFITGKKQTPEECMAGTPSLSSSDERLAYTLERLQRMGAGYEVYIYEATHSILKTLGYHIVKTIVPQLLPLYLNENLPSLNSKRLKEVPEKLGFKAADVLNPWPHPFP